MQQDWTEGRLEMHKAYLFRLVGDEADALHLTNVVESDDPDVCGWVGLLALVHLLQHLGRVGAPEHRQLPHHPVTSIIVSW